ncbi:MAG: hypothetical protein ACI9P3_003128 [Bradyrhizobium sp.]|jgi:hypothetical protein
MALDNIAECGDFQAEYEGSIPFTRSSVFNRLRHGAGSIWAKALLLPRIKSGLWFAPRGAFWCRSGRAVTARDIRIELGPG